MIEHSHLGNRALFYSYGIYAPCEGRSYIRSPKFGHFGTLQIENPIGTKYMLLLCFRFLYAFDFLNEKETIEIISSCFFFFFFQSICQLKCCKCWFLLAVIWFVLFIYVLCFFFPWHQFPFFLPHYMFAWFCWFFQVFFCIAYGCLWKVTSIIVISFTNVI